MVTKLKQLVGQLLYKKTIAVLGLSFKAGTSDVRNSLALKVIDHLEKDGAIVRAHDPVAIPEVHVLKPDLTYCQDPYEAVEDADALLILTEWPSFKDLDYGRIKALMAGPFVVDGRNLLDPDTMADLGFSYVGIGRPWGCLSPGAPAS